MTRTTLTKGQSVEHNGMNMQVVNVHIWNVSNGTNYIVDTEASLQLQRAKIKNQVDNNLGRVASGLEPTPLRDYSFEEVCHTNDEPLTMQEVALYHPQVGITKLFI